MAESHMLKQGFYPIASLGLSPNTKYYVQNTSFADRVYVLVFDSKPNFLQAIRLKPQSNKFILIPLETNYKIIVVGDGIVTLSTV